jgi:DNA-binding PadR family transcriptional regulator
MPASNPPSSAPLNATQGSLLGFLHDGPKTGWDLLQEASHGLARFWNVTASHVYRELKTLEDRGLIAAGERGARDRRPYSITPAGTAAFAEWIAQVPGPEQIRIPLLVSLWFAKHLDDATLARFIASHRVTHQERLNVYREVAAGTADGDPHIDAVVHFGISYEEAFLDWLASLPFGRGRDEVEVEVDREEPVLG